MATGYVANWGNDLNDGLSWETAKKSLQGAKDSGLKPLYVKGFFNSTTETSNIDILGHAVFSGVGLPSYGLIAYYNDISDKIMHDFSDRALRGFTVSNIISRNIIYNCNWAWRDSYNNGLLSAFYLKNNLVYNCNYASYGVKYESWNNTFHNIGVLYGGNNNNYYLFENKYSHKHNIFSNLSVAWNRCRYPTYCLFINCKFKFTEVSGTNNETDFSYPVGSTDEEKMDDIRNRIAAVCGGNPSDYLEGCKYYSGSYNDVFVDADNDNFYLVNNATNPALHMSYDGSYIGARPPAATTFKIGNANTVTNINQTTGDIIDQNLPANAYWTTIQDSGAVREISSFDTMAEMAYRNGLSINTVSYMSADITTGSNVLISGKQYQVRDDAGTGGTIVLNDSGGTVMSAWDTFTAVDEGGGAGLGFSSVDGLTVREIDISKYDERIRIKVSTDDATLATANEITMLLHETPLVNVDSNNIPIKGNGDVGFDAATAVPLQARYMQIWVDIQADQLYAR